MKTWTLYFDGACRGNPGHGALGFVIKERTAEGGSRARKEIKSLQGPDGPGTDALLHSHKQYLGKRKTNNECEYGVRKTCGWERGLRARPLCAWSKPGSTSGWP